MISVIIPKYEDDLYLIRCLNSIKRQTYKDTEILVIDGNCQQDIIDKYGLRIVETETNKCNGLNKAIAQAKGDYIYFCNVSSVPAPNTLSSLLNEDDVTCLYANSYVMVGNSFEEKDRLLSCYGKLFDKSKIAEKKIQFEGNCLYAEYFFVIEYVSCFEKLCKKDEVSIYDTEPVTVCEESDINIEVTQWKKCLQTIKSSTEEVRDVLSKAMAQVIREQIVCSEEIARLAEEELHTDYELNYACLAPVLKLLWNDIAKNKNVKAFDSFREYLGKYEGENLADVLLQACGLKGCHYEYIKNNNVKQCLFLIEESERLATEKKELLDTVRAIMADQGSGLTKIGSKWYYYSNGKLDRMYHGMVKNQYGWWYVSDGTIDYDYKGLSRNRYGWWYISNGTIDRSYTGLTMSEDGVWRYITNGTVDRGFIGLVETAGGYKYISNGVIDKEYTGLFKTAEGKWVYIQNGTINTDFIGLARNNHGWWYVENGTIDFSYNGFAKNNCGWCEVINGKAQPDGKNVKLNAE